MFTNYGAATYGDLAADLYDEIYADLPDIEPCLDVLTEYAGSGRALELGVGTGRLALPLAERGVGIYGLDASKQMLDRLARKDPESRVVAVEGDFADVPVDGPFSLVFVGINTFFALPDQEAQVRCFANVSTRLAPAGRFVLEAFVPDSTRWKQNQLVSAYKVGIDSAIFEIAKHDPIRQRIQSQHVLVEPGGLRMFPLQIRYCYPPELDLMATMAGLELEHRWASWNRERFTAASRSHVSVYRRVERGGA